MKLKKKMITATLKRIRMPGRMTLKAYTSYYTKLIAQYGNKSSLKVGYLDGYYSGTPSGHWLYERRLETDAELAKRQAKFDKNVALQKAETVQRRKRLKLEKARIKVEMKREEKRKMEKKIETVKTMVSVLRAAGYKISPKVVSKAAR